jgi:DNA-binding Lrp family transcriptional regulator
MTALDANDTALLAAIEPGLPLQPNPYAVLGNQIGLSEAEVISRLERLLRDGVIKRLGLVVRHRALGYTSNAMVVWDVADERVDDLAAKATTHPFVTLCYRRPRRPPAWPYNLFCMIHGRDRETVLGQIETLNDATGLGEFPTAVLFSRRCFKQRGARYAPRSEDAA